MDEFRVGDIVELINNETLSAPIGTLAKVYRVSWESLEVTWLDKVAQNNGGYYKSRFRLADDTGKMPDTRDYLKAISER